MLNVLLQLDIGTRVLGIGVGVFLVFLAVIIAGLIFFAGRFAEKQW